MMCDKLLSLYDYADNSGIDVYYFPMEETESLSLACGWIAMDTDKFNTTADEAVHLAHELGHIETLSFYTVHSKYSLRAKCEAQADRWAIKRLIPLAELKNALKCGFTEKWELAEYFNVTENFVVKAVDFYRRKDLI